MPRRIANTTVPRNPIARSPLMHRGGAHQRSRTAERQQSRAQVNQLADNWREDLEYEPERIEDLNDEH